MDAYSKNETPQNFKRQTGREKKKQYPKKLSSSSRNSDAAAVAVKPAHFFASLRKRRRSHAMFLKEGLPYIIFHWILEAGILRMPNILLRLLFGKIQH